MSANNKLVIFSGSSNRTLAEHIASHLYLSLGRAELRTFSDGEIWCKYHEDLRGAEVYLIQSTNAPANNILELLVMIDAARRASAKTVVAVIPYMGYARQDRKDQPRVPITAKLFANMLTSAGCDRVISMDIHSAQGQGFYDIPSDMLSSIPIFYGLFEELRDSLVVVAPNVGRIKMARNYAELFDKQFAIMDKRKNVDDDYDISIIGNVEGQNALVVDDLIDSGKTLSQVVHSLKAHGALKIFAAITHPLFSGNAISIVKDLDIEQLYVSDTISIEGRQLPPNVTVRSSAKLLAEAIYRISKDEPISPLFNVTKKAK